MLTDTAKINKQRARSVLTHRQFFQFFAIKLVLILINKIQFFLQFWKARTLDSRESIIFDLVQEQTGDIASNKVSFTATFKQPCNLETHPIYASILVE